MSDSRHFEVTVQSVRSPLTIGRKENQDNYLVIDDQGRARYLEDERPVDAQVAGWPRGHRRMAVLDGMGGHAGGREIAERVVAGLLELSPATELGALSRELDALHARLHRPYEKISWPPGCTLTLLEIPPGQRAMLFHVGDSRLYRVDDREARCLTVDHVPATEQAMEGKIGEARWMEQVHEGNENLICQAYVMGSVFGMPDIPEEKLTVLGDDNLPSFLHGLGDRRWLDLEPGAVYLLATDGLWARRSPESFIRCWPTILCNPSCSLDEGLVRLFEEYGKLLEQDERHGLPVTASLDNCTAIAFRCG